MGRRMSNLRRRVRIIRCSWARECAALWAAAVRALAVLAAARADAKEQRDPHKRAACVTKQPCPANGKTRGACPGYVVDHIKPLCAGGADHPSNMRWQTKGEAKKKDREERRLCGKEKTF